MTSTSEVMRLRQLSFGPLELLSLHLEHQVIVMLRAPVVLPTDEPLLNMLLQQSRYRCWVKMFTHLCSLLACCPPSFAHLSCFIDTTNLHAAEAAYHCACTANICVGCLDSTVHTESCLEHTGHS